MKRFNFSTFRMGHPSRKIFAESENAITTQDNNHFLTKIIMKQLKLLALMSAFALAANAANAQDSGALLDLLVKKKVITDQEAETTRAQLAKDYATYSQENQYFCARSKQITLYGDARLRYDYREANALGAPVAKVDRHCQCRPVPLSSAHWSECDIGRRLVRRFPVGNFQQWTVRQCDLQQRRHHSSVWQKPAPLPRLAMLTKVDYRQFHFCGAALFKILHLIHG